MSKILKQRLDNGDEVYFRSKADLEILAREFLADDQYLSLIDELQPGACVFDLGANIGFFAMELNRRLTSGTAYCFEPIPDTFEVLQKNAGALGNIHAILIPKGVSDKPGHAEFVCFDHLSVASTMFHEDNSKTRADARKFIVQELCSRNVAWRAAFAIIPISCWWPFLETIRRLYSRKKMVSCSLVTLSEIIDQYSVDRIDLLKIDVEGAEDSVIAGIQSRHWPIIDRCVIECHRSSQQAEQIADVLQQHGFDTVIEPVMPNVTHLNMVTGRRRTLNTCDISLASSAIDAGSL